MLDLIILINFYHLIPFLGPGYYGCNRIYDQLCLVLGNVRPFILIRLAWTVSYYILNQGSMNGPGFDTCTFGPASNGWSKILDICLLYLGPSASCTRGVGSVNCVGVKLNERKLFLQCTYSIKLHVLCSVYTHWIIDLVSGAWEEVKPYETLFFVQCI